MPKTTERPVDSTEESTQLKAVPHRRKRKRVLRVFVRLLLVALLGVSGFFIWKNWDTLSPENVLVWINEQFAGGQKGDGFPVTTTGDTVVAMVPVNNNLTLLTDTSLLMYNTSGGEVVRRPHSFAQPLLKAAGDYVLVMESGGTRLSLEKRSSTVLSHTVTEAIVTAAVAENGYFAVVTGASQSYVSQVAVYDKKGTEIYRWKSSEWMVADVALQADGKAMAVVGISARDGNLQSALLTFKLDKSAEQPLCFSEQGLLLFAVSYLPSGGIAAVGDTAGWIVASAEGQPVKYAYAERKLLGYAVGYAGLGLVLQAYGSSAGGELIVLDSSGQPQPAIPFASPYRDLCAYKDGFFLLTDRHLLAVNNNSLKGTLDIPPDGRLVAALGDKAIVLGLTTLNEYTF